MTIAVDTQQSLSFAADPDAFWPGGAPHQHPDPKIGISTAQPGYISGIIDKNVA